MLVKHSSPQPALNVLMRHRQALASNPRGKISAFGGLVIAEPNGKSTVVPEYGIPVAEIYKKFAIKTLQNDGSLNILSVPSVQDVSSIDDLPSWVPGWSVSDQAATLQPLENDEKVKGVFRPDFAATGSSRWKSLFDKDYTRLRVQGTIIDRILLTTPEAPTYVDQDDLIQINDPNLIIQGQKILKQWENISLCRAPWVQYPTGEKIMNVYWQTILASTIWISYEDTRLVFYRWDQSNCLCRLLQFVFA